MKRKRLLTLVGSICIVLVLVVMPFIVACTGPTGAAGAAGAARPAAPPGPPGKAGPKGPPASPSIQSGPSLTVVPPIQVAKRGNTITLLGAGLKPKEAINIRIYNIAGLELDITNGCQAPVEVNENGAFEAVMGSKIRVRNFPVGTYSVSIVGRGEQILATAPMKVIKPAKK